MGRWAPAPILESRVTTESISTGRNVLARGKEILAQPLMIAALIIGGSLLYAGWIGYQYVRNQLFDFNLYYLAAYGLRQGVDVYALTRDFLGGEATGWAALAAETGVIAYAPPYRYPPLTAQWVLPLTWLPYRTAGMIWLALSALAFMASAFWLGRLANRAYGVGLAFLLLLLFVPMLTTLHAGQVNGFVLLALVLAVWGVHRGNSWLAGIGVALGALLKLVPIVLVGYFFVRKLWAATLIAAGAIVLMLLSSYLTFSPETLPSYLASFFTVGQPGSVFATPPNQSLNGVLGRLLSGVLPEAEIYRLALLAALVVVGITAWRLWPLQFLPPAWRFEVGAIICAVTLITPYTWYHQLALLFVPLFFVVEHYLTQEDAGAVLIIGALVVLSNLHGLFWHQLTPFPWLTSFPFVLVLTLWIVQLGLCRIVPAPTADAE